MFLLYEGGGRGEKRIKKRIKMILHYYLLICGKTSRDEDQQPKITI